MIRASRLARLWLCIAGFACSGDARPPNVLLIVVDDMGWMDSGAYGSRYYETPHIDRLARRGVRFTDAYAASPSCSPTRASILTGKYPARLGVTGAVCHQPPRPPGSPDYPDAADPGRATISPHSLRYLDPAEYTLAEAFRDAGYHTGHFGKWHLGLTEAHWPGRQGYQVTWHGQPDAGPPGPHGYFSPLVFDAGNIEPGPRGQHLTERLTDRVVEFLGSQAARPFFATVWHFSVHGPWHEREERIERFRNKEDPRGKQGNPIMAAMLERVDESLGRIVAELDALGIAEDTIVVLTSDNGGNAFSNSIEDTRTRGLPPDHPRREWLSSYRKYAGFRAPTDNHPLREGKGFLFEGGVRIPLVVAWADAIPAGATSGAIVSSIDLYPTLLELAGVGLAPGIRVDGVSLASHLRDPSRPLARDAVFNFDPQGNPKQPPGVSVRRGRWKLIRWFETRAGYPVARELYDLSVDLGETSNVANHHPDVVRDLDRAIDAFLDDTGARVPLPNPAHRPGMSGGARIPDAGF